MFIFLVFFFLIENYFLCMLLIISILEFDGKLCNNYFFDFKFILVSCKYISFPFITNKHKHKQFMPPLFIRYKVSLIKYAIQTHDSLIIWIIKGELLLYFFLIFEKKIMRNITKVNLGLSTYQIKIWRFTNNCLLLLSWHIISFSDLFLFYI